MKTRFRKMPVVIEAEQFLPMPGKALPDGVKVAQSNPGHGSDQPIYYVSTLEGNMIARPGDWIITGIRGEQYPCRHEIFMATYEEVP